MYHYFFFLFFFFSKEVFPAEYGPQYDSDLQTLFSEFLFRLAQLLPVPDLEQVRGVIIVIWIISYSCERNDLKQCFSVLVLGHPCPPKSNDQLGNKFCKSLIMTHS